MKNINESEQVYERKTFATTLLIPRSDEYYATRTLYVEGYHFLEADDAAQCICKVLDEEQMNKISLPGIFEEPINVLTTQVDPDDVHEAHIFTHEEIYSGNFAEIVKSVIKAN